MDAKGVVVSATRFEPKVAVEGRVCDFGECVRESLLRAASQRVGSANHSGELRYVQSEYANSILDLRLAEDSARGTKFEHAQICPAREFNDPQPGRTIRVGVATVLERGGRVLITQRHSQLRSFPNVWVVPGGHIDEGETLDDTATRELREETGLSTGITPHGLMGIWESTFPHRASLGKMTHHHAVCYMWARQAAEEPIMLQTNEVQAVAWLNAAQAQDVLSANSESIIHIFTPVSSKKGEDDASTATDDWHDARAQLDPNFTPRTAQWLRDNMSAGTRFALELWLERIHNTKL